MEQTTKFMPDSVLEAAKKTAEALGLSWSEVQPVYRELQAEVEGDGFLPKSSGRTIFTAHPNHVARLLIGLGLRSAKITPRAANYIVHGLTLHSKPISMGQRPSVGSITPALDELARLLSDRDAAETIAQVRFDPAEKSITITRRDGRGELHFAPAVGELWSAGWTNFRDRVLEALALDTSRRIHTVTVIDGAALSEIAETINWRRQDQGPVRHAPANESAE